MSNNHTTTLADRTQKASFPPGLHNALLFSGFNALSYPLVLSSPMVLYAKTLGASATVLGIIAGMMPLTAQTTYRFRLEGSQAAPATGSLAA